MDPTADVGDTKISSQADAIQYAADAQVPDAYAMTGFPVSARSLLMSSASSPHPVTSPPGESTSRTTVPMAGSAKTTPSSRAISS